MPTSHWLSHGRKASKVMEINKRKRYSSPVDKTLVSEAKKRKHSEPSNKRRYSNDSRESERRLRKDRRGPYFSEKRTVDLREREVGKGRERERGWKRRLQPWTGRGRQGNTRKLTKRGVKWWNGRRENGNRKTRNHGFFSEPSDAAITYGINSLMLTSKLERNANENKMETITYLHKICQSPNRHCVRKVFTSLWKDKFFRREDVLTLLEQVLSDHTTDALDTTVLLHATGDIVKSYCSILNSIGHDDEILQDFLIRFEMLVGKSQSVYQRSLDDFEYLRSPVDCNIGLVLQPSISALYNNLEFEKRNVSDSFGNSRSLLERVYHLYKEDITRTLVRGLRRLKYYLKKSTDLEKFRNDDIRVYRDLQFISSIATISNGLIWEMQLDTSQPLVKTIMNRKRKLLERGNLICLSNDVFKRNIVYGTIVESDKEADLTRNGIVRVEFQQSFTINQANRGHLFTLVESKSNCLANINALIAVKVKLDENEQLPFEKQIVYHQQNSNPPNYLLFEQEDRRRVSFECLRTNSDIKEEETKPGNSNDDSRIVVKDIMEGMLSNVCSEKSGLHLLETETWPSPGDLGMDISQYRAFSDGLTQGLSLIQGPPGTGKTVIALKIIEMMLTNGKVWSNENIGPIILLSYTNHALDQFLEGITRMPIMDSTPITDIVRVGAQCKTKSLDRFNLKHRRKENNTFTRKEALKKLHMAAEYHNKLAKATRTYLTTLVHEQFLQQINVIPGHLYRSLLAPRSSSLPSDEAYLCKWLSIFQDDFVSQKLENEECIDTKEELESDENLDDGLEQEDFEIEPISLEDQDRVKGLMKHPRPILPADIDEDRNKGIKSWSFVEPKHKRAILQEVTRRMTRAKPMSVAKERNIADVWDLSVDDRWRLYKLWIHKILTTLEEDIMTVRRKYKNAYSRYKECRHSEDVKIFKKARIVAMTTTRAAIDHEILRRTNSKIMVIEEAAEVPDHHILASLVPSLQHLVMIGDHQQLKPGYNDYRTAMKYGLNVSIFERLITSGLQFQQLQFQHRMRPEIADLLTPYIYSELQNHASVMEIADVRGIKNNVFFLNHSEKEHADSHQDTKSHKNQHEVDFITQLYRYLRLQGYDSGDITVLTTYKEQERLLQRSIRNIEKKEIFASSKTNLNNCDLNSQNTDCDGNQHNNSDQSHISNYNSKGIMQLEGRKKTIPGARVTTVDNFQGEESKIVLLSLVRSNSEGKIGFLKEPNRICVALSRAKAGLYVIGDCNVLRMKNDLWKQILQKAEGKGYVGSSLTLYCKNHPLTKTHVAKAVDFQKVPDGGCRQKCPSTLICGHDCPKMCHVDDANHTFRPCVSICEKLCSLGHKCMHLCYECKESGECLPCKFKVLKTLPNCGHVVSVACFEELDQYKCTERCENILECGHKCQRSCGMTCNNSENCNVLVKVTADCGHEIQTACHTKEDAICSVKCTKKLTCGHLCKGTCRSCFSGHFHQQCREKKLLRLKCKHIIDIDCALAYSKRLETCQKECKWRCEHLACERECGEPCTRLPCNARCTQRLRCRHLCELLQCDHNDDHWCRKCSRNKVNGGLHRTKLNVPNPHYIRLQGCNCIFQTELLDEILKHQVTLLDAPRCPNCNKEIIDMRYLNFIKSPKRLEDRRIKNYVELPDNLHQVFGWLEKVAKCFIPDKSLEMKYTKVTERLHHRLDRNGKTFSSQELRDLSVIAPKMVISLKKCIERSKSKQESVPGEQNSDSISKQERVSAEISSHLDSNQECVTAEIGSHLEECEKKCNIIFSDFFEDIKHLKSGAIKELDIFLKVTSKESTTMMILPPI